LIALSTSVVLVVIVVEALLAAEVRPGNDAPFVEVQEPVAIQAI
jgi:hypothetical protein